MKKYQWLACLVLLTQASPAQDPANLAAQHHHVDPATAPLSLEQLESAALQNNPQIRVAAQKVRLAEAGVSGAGALDDPSLMYRGWGVPFSEPWNLNRAQHMFMVSQTIPGPGKRELRSEIASQEVETAKAELEAVKQQILAQVRVAYYELLRTRDELRLHDLHTSVAQQALESAKIKYAVGKVPQQDVLKAQVAATRLMEHLLIFQEHAGLARAELNSLMGRSPDAPLEVSGEYRLPGQIPSLPDLEATALAQMPELTAIRSEAQREGLNLRLARKAYTPDFTVAGGYMLMGAGERDRNRYMAEFSMNLPWLNTRKNDSSIAQAEAKQTLRRDELEARQSLVLNRIQHALVRAQASKQLAELYRDTLRPQAESTFRSASAAYQSDRTDFLNLLEAENAWLDIDLAYYNALAEFEQRFAELELAVGAPIGRRAAQAPQSASEVTP
jgi:outer membrane protein TolC